MSAADASTQLAAAVDALLDAVEALQRGAFTERAENQVYAPATERLQAVCRTCGPAVRLPDALVARMKAALRATSPQAWYKSMPVAGVVSALHTCAPSSAAAAQVRRGTPGMRISGVRALGGHF